MMRRHVTYANVMATIAVFIALGGGAFAASSLIGSDGKVRACVDKSGDVRIVKKGKKCARGETSVAWHQTGKTGKTGKTGPQGVAGRSGADGADGSALGFASVLSNGTLDTAKSKGVVGISATCGLTCPTPPSPATGGGICFDLAFTPKNAVATVESGGAGGVTTAFVTLTPVVGDAAGPGACPVGFGDARVNTFVVTGAQAGNQAQGIPFHVLFN